MKRTHAFRSITSLAAAASVLALLAFATATQPSAQAGPPAIATDITAAEIRAVIDHPTGGADRLIKAVDMGRYNVGVGVLKRGPTKPGAPVGAINHTNITEVYYIISGSGTMLTGGVVVDVKAAAADSEIVRVAVGPSNQGTFKEPAQRRRVSAGDMVIVPPGVFHGFDEVTTGIEYVVVRPDPDKVLPAGFVHPALKK
jgi:mannose-6-phosphate isomerase-like protein (cupin superfamily)